MHAAITLTEIERAIATKDHTGKVNANTPPRRGDPPRAQTTMIAVQSAPPLINSIQSSGSTMKISAYKLDAACSRSRTLSV